MGFYTTEAERNDNYAGQTKSIVEHFEDKAALIVDDGAIYFIEALCWIQSHYRAETVRQYYKSSKYALQVVESYKMFLETVSDDFIFSDFLEEELYAHIFDNQ